MTKELLSKIIDYLNDDENLKWSTARTMIKKLDIQGFQPLELDAFLIQYFQESENCEIRFSTLPSKNNLDVLWGSTNRIKQRNVIDIYKQDQQILIDELDRIDSKNLFLSHSFKDLAPVIELSKKLMQENIFTWLAETEILKYDHINQSVKDAIESLPYFGVFITENLLNSIWSAKEFEFALRNKKEVIGFLHTENPEVFDKIKDSRFEHGNSISREIYGQFFDNHSNVKFLLYPYCSNEFCLNLKKQGKIVEWNYLKNLEQ